MVTVRVGVRAMVTVRVGVRARVRVRVRARATLSATNSRPGMSKAVTKAATASLPTKGCA